MRTRKPRITPQQKHLKCPQSSSMRHQHCDCRKQDTDDYSDDSGKGESDWSDVTVRSISVDTLNNDCDEGGRKYELLKLGEENIKKRIRENDDEINRLLCYLSVSVTPDKLARISSYVVDLEKITFLLHSLSRRMAAAELKIKLTMQNALPHRENSEWGRKHQKLSQQFKEAKDIKCALDRKYLDICKFLETSSGIGAKLKFRALMEEKIKLMITFKEVGDKIKIHDRERKRMTLMTSI